MASEAVAGSVGKVGGDYVEALDGDHDCGVGEEGVGGGEERVDLGEDVSGGGHDVGCETLHEALGVFGLDLRADLVEGGVVGEVELDGGGAEHIGGEDSLGALRDLELGIEGELDLDGAGVFVVVSHLADLADLEAVEVDGSGDSEASHVGVIGIIIVGGVEEVNAFEEIDSKEEDSERQEGDGAD